MGKILKITGISLLAVLAVLLILPFALKGKIEEVVKSEANKRLNARLEFRNLDLSFIRNFPHATLSLNDLCITGTGEFEGDTLVALQQVSATVNISSLWGDSGYEVSRIMLEEGRIHAIAHVNGNVNWDIMKMEDGSDEAPADTTASDFKLLLKKVEIKNTSLYYDDEVSKMNVSMEGINLNLSGDMTADQTRIKTSFSSDALTVVMEKIPYLSKVKTSADIQLDADWKNMKFVFSENTIRLNEIQASLDGWLSMNDDESLDMDLQLNAPQTQFKDILSMVPAIYTNDFKDLKTSGEVTLGAVAKGTMKGDTLPSFDVKMTVDNAMFQYPSLPKSVNQIHLKAQITNPGGSADRTVIDISRFHFEMGGNPFDVTLHLSTPVSDPNVALSASGQLNLGMIKEVYPLGDTELNGNLNANLKIATRMTAIEKQQFENVQAEGLLKVNDMVYKSEEMKDVLIRNASLSFSPRYVDLSNCIVQIGKNDLTANGKLENFIPYALKDETLKGSLTVTSNYLNLNDFMTEDVAESSAQADTAGIGVIVVPKNLDFNLSGTFQEVKFDQLDMKNVSGQLLVRDGKVDMKNLKMNALGGSIDVNGYYDTSQNPKQPDVSLDLSIQNASFAQTFSTFETVRKFAPIFESILGNYSTTLSMKAPLSEDFMPVLTGLTANGLLQSNDVEVKNVQTLNVLAATLKNENLKDLKVKDLKLPFSISNGRLTTNPFDVNFGSGKMNLSGSTGLDQSLDYVAKVDLSDKLTKGYVSSVNVKIGGTFTSPKITVDAKDLVNQGINKLLGGKEGSSLSETVNEEVGQQADAIRKQAADAGAKLVAEAEKQGQNLINEAKKTKNVLMKAAAVTAAEAGAKKLKEEAQKQADQLNAEAEKQIKALEDKAKSNSN